MNEALERLRRQRCRHRQRSTLARIGVVGLGFVLLVLGVILVPLPGPGVVVMAAGLFLLALEFSWAERLLVRTIGRLERAREAGSEAGPLVRALAAALVIAGVAAAVAIASLWDVPFLPV